MDTSILHITNGDITTQTLQNLTFKGTFITWREMLCEGKTITDVGSENFWKTRFDFLKNSYKISKKKFINFTLKEYRNLCKEKKHDEIVLWFEHNLFSQINMLAVISWLKRYRKGYKISLIQNKNATKKSKLVSFSQLPNTQLQKHFKNRIQLSLDDIEYADYIWQLYCSDSPLRLETAYQLNRTSPFIYLEKTLKNHLLRFPSIKNGLNYVENSILNTAKEHSFSSKDKLVQHLIQNQNNLGFNNAQYIQKIKKLHSFFQTFNPIIVHKKTFDILENKLNYYSQLRSDFSYLGGTKKYSYLYINNTEKLLKITS